MSCKQPYNHHDNGDQEDDDRDPVHAMHEEDVRIAGCVRVALFEE